MKQFLLFFFIVMLALKLSAQPCDIPAITARPPATAPGVERLDVTYTKTTHLVFPAAIISIDRGSEDILVQKAAGVENVLKIKAGIKGFEETSLGVITAGNRLYSFIVNYTNTPTYVSKDVSVIMGQSFADTADSTNSIASSKKLVYTDALAGDVSIKQYAGKARIIKSNLKGLGDQNSGISLTMDGLYIHDNTFFARLQLKNTTNINYDLEQLRFYIRDKKQGKRTASQELEISPILVDGDTATIKGSGKATWVIALPKFTIPDGKLFIIELMEHNGGRHLEIKVKNRKLVKAATI